jgi:hypothetical protein
VDAAGGGFIQVQENPVKKMLLAALLSTFAATAFAQDAKPTCKAQAAEQKLAGAALKSFLTKCKKDATAACQTDAAEKKLAGAAKRSHITKCVKDAVGS